MKIILSCFIIVLLYVNLHAQLIDQQIANAAGAKYNRFAKNRFLDINNSLLDRLKGASDIKKLNVVNTWVNQIRYASDKSVYGVSDYWATLYEFVGKNRGDCEDYTITKYYIFKALGVDPKRLRTQNSIFLKELLESPRFFNKVKCAFFSSSYDNI